jgi:hypothetical protein
MARTRGSTSHPGIRAGGTYTRDGKTYRRRSAKIAHPQSRPQLVRVRRRHRNKGALYAAGATCGLAAVTYLGGGRWGAFFVLLGLAGGIMATHLVWQHHQNRRAMGPPKPRRVRDAQTGQRPPKTRTLTDSQASAYAGNWKAGDKQCVTHGASYADNCATCRASGDRSEPKPAKAEPEEVLR